MLNLQEVAGELEAPAGVAVPAGRGRAAALPRRRSRASPTIPHWKDLVLFHEYFHGDTGRGVGASHQTGWTALVLRCIEDQARRRGAPAQATARPAGQLAASRAMSAPIAVDDRTEWLEADGLGGFASGTTLGVRTRRYHALLLAATTPPTGRMVLVNGLDAWVEIRRRRRSSSPASATRRACSRPSTGRRWSRSSPSRGRPGPIAWPTARRIAHELFVPHGRAVVALRWRLVGRRDAPLPFAVRPFLSGRDSHALHHENPAFRFDGGVEPASASSGTPYDGVPAVHALSNGSYRAEPQWYRGFLYSEERARGLDYVEDLAAPGVFEWDLGEADAVLLLGADGALGRRASARRTRFDRLRRSEQRAARAVRDAAGARRRRVPGAARRREDDRRRLSVVHRLGPRHVHRAARALPRDRPAGRRAVHPARVGRPRLRGHAAQPLRGPGRRPEYNSVDASLWYVVAVHEYLDAAEAAGRPASARDRKALGEAVQASSPATCAARATASAPTDDGLLAAGEPGVQLTWMDAKVGDWVVTPRIGKPVEIQALWLNALRIAERVHAAATPSLYERGLRAFARALLERRGRVPLRRGGCRSRAPARLDGTLRPNQILAVGGLPYAVLDGERARQRRGYRGAAGSGPRSACGRSPPARPGTCRATRAACASATAPTIRARSGPGCSARSWRPGCGCAGTAPRCGPRPGGGSSSRCWITCPWPGSATSPRSPTRSRRTRRGAVRSRRGRWARRSGSTGGFSRPVEAPRRQGGIVRSPSLAERPVAAKAAPAPPMMRHLPEYLMEAALLGLFMISACTFTVLLEHPGLAGARRHSRSRSSAGCSRGSRWERRPSR